MKPVEIEYLIKNGTRATLEKISADLLKVGSDGSQSGDAISAAFLRTEVQVSLLRDEIATLETKLLDLQNANPDIDQTANIAEAEKLKATIESLKIQLVQLEQTGENTQVLPQSLPNAKRQFDGLHFSIQQMAREMPSLAMGPQMFFLAISNNLPIFTDELARAKKEYAELIATGQKGTPVWKQVVKSLFSWQTALTTGIMLLVMYGDEIVKSISDMTGWGAAKRAMTKASKESLEIEDKAIVSLNTQIGKIKALHSIIENSNAGYNLRNKALKELSELCVEYNGELTKEGVLINNNTDAIDNYLVALEKKIKMQSYEDQLRAAFKRKVEAETIVEDAENKLDDQIKKGNNLPGQMKGGYSNLLKRMEQDIVSARENVEAEEQRITEIKAKILSFDIDADAVDPDSLMGLNLQIEELRKNINHATNNSEYNAINDEIKALEARARSITGTNDNTEEQYENERLASHKTAANAELEIERSKITDKIKLIEFERDAQIEAIEAEKRAYQDKYGEDADMSGFDRQIKATSDQADIDIADVRTAEKESEQSEYEKRLAAYQTFAERYEAVRAEHEENLRIITSKGGTQADVDVENQTYEDDLKSLNDEVLATIDDFKSLGVEATDRVIDEMIARLQSTKTDLESDTSGANNSTTISAVNAELERLKKLKEENDKPSKGRSLKEWQDMEKQLNDCGDTLQDLGNSIGGVAGEAIKTAGTIASSTTSMISGIAQFAEICEEGIMNTAGTAVSAVKAVETASVILAVIGAVIQVATQINNLFKSKAEEKEALAKKEEENARRQFIAEYEVNQLYRERYEWSKKIGETDIENARRNFVEANKQKDAIAKEYSEILNKLYNTSSYEIVGHNVDYGDWWNPFDKREITPIYGTYQGFTYDDLLRYEHEGGLTEEAAELFEILKNLKAEGADVNRIIEESTEARKEFAAGLSFEDTVDKAMDDLLDGTITAGEAFAEIMQGAAKNMLRDLMDDDVKEWYEGFATAGLDGYTDDEREYWKKRWEELQSDNEQRKEDIEQATGVDFSSATSQSGRSGSFETMTQDQGTKLEGLFTASEMRIARVENGVESVATQMNTAVGHLAKIETNTGESATSLKSLVDKVEQIIRDGVKLK